MLNKVRAIRAARSPFGASNYAWKQGEKTASRLFSTSSTSDDDKKYDNIPESIWKLTEKKLYQNPQHPLATLLTKTENFFARPDITDIQIPGEKFKVFSDFKPLVKTEDCFDALRIPPDHVSRQPTDTYYKSKTECLRTHTSVHQIPLIKDPSNNAFLVVGDVYRKDTVDRTHYPAFHQMEGVRIFDWDAIDAKNVNQAKEIAQRDLKQVLENLAREVFGDVEMKWSPDNFPFTDPSLELEVYYNNEWLEILGCGVIHDQILTRSGRDIEKQVGWAFGLGLERWAMKLFGIDDIRLFWSDDKRFIN